MRRLRLGLLAVLAAVTTLAVTASTAAASTYYHASAVPSLAQAGPGDRAALGCYDGGVWTPRLIGSDATTFTPTAPPGYYITSNRCNDINFIVGSTPGNTNWSALTRVCWVRHGTCNSWKSVPWDGKYHVIATDVLDGTRFRIETHWPESMWGSEWNAKVAY
ncbi:hypothetical protein FKR81_00075 [Lentzea tibetensis]|uniref:Secreted protein n=1 Tax=Lentzea tibetensis TaxID=2591470 RepID=A0A563F219_9PSEU|nr:hypothetical protein [Lentzea tibetensis]TWP54010.1 hypothetical protein FKR81_00075 [Lentzea tibetensis]